MALVTPFTSENKVDYLALGKLIDLHIESKTDGILLFGTTGESEALSKEEQKNILEYTLNRLNNRIKVIVSVTSNVTEKVLEKIEFFKKYEFDSYLVITPYYNKTNESGMINHFQIIADRADKPIIIYNVPRRTGICISSNAVEVLSHHKNIIGIKEASGDIDYQVSLMPYLSDGFYLYAGDDILILPSMALGAKGVISVVANLYPGVMKEIYTLSEKNDKNARDLFLRYYPVFKACFVEVSPIPIKFLLNYKGHNVGKCRLPYGELSHNSKMKLIDAENKI